MRILAALSLALSACVFYVPLDEEDAAVSYPDAVEPDAADPGPDTCEKALPCPAPSPGKVTICGRIREVADEQASLGDQVGVWCDPDAPTPSGACSLAIKFAAALPFATDPVNAVPLPVGDSRIDACGRFRGVDIEEPELGYLAIAVDDAEGNADQRLLTWVAIPAAAGYRGFVDVYTQTHNLDEQWSAAAGLPQPSFGTRGALLLIFVDQYGDPVPGVTITENGSTEPNNDYCFSDIDPDTRLEIDPARASTGANGAALKILSSLVNHSGTGGEPPSCTWPSNLAASTVGTLYVQRFRLEQNGFDCPQ